MCTHEVKRVRKRVKEFGIEELWDKDARFSHDKIDGMK